MNRTSTKPAVLALHIGLALGVTQTASAQLFPSAIALSDLDGSNGIAINGDVIRTGTAVDGAGDVNGDGIDDLIIGAPTGGSTPGESYVVFGSDGGLASPFPLSLINGLNGFAMIGYGDLAFTGGSVSGAGDINGDGIDDLIVGAPFIFGNRGHSYVVFGTESGFPNPLLLSSLDGQNGITVIGDSGSQSGGTVSNAGDVNGDGVDDVLIAAATANPNGLESGRSYVIFGPVDDLPNPFQLSAINGLNGFVLEGQAQYDYAGVSVSAAGDINGDGIDDLIISAPGADVNGLDSGNSYVVFGSDAGLPSPFNFAILNGINGFVMHGETANDRSGISVSGAGDVNGDGIDDVIIGAPYAATDGKYSGRSYVVFGSNSGFPSAIELSELDGTDGFVLDGAAEDDNSGRSVSAAGDINADGIGDLLIGANYADTSGDSSGRSYVVFGSDQGFASPFPLFSLDGNNGFAINALDQSDQLGRSVSAAGDINGDGIDDLIVGAPYTSDGTIRGSAYVLFGRASRDLAVTKSNAAPFVATGSPTTWLIEVSNSGASSVSDAVLTDPVPSGVINASWTCTGFDGAVCANPSGSGSINEPITLPAGARLIYALTATVTAIEPEIVSNTATVSLAEGQIDLNPTNNSATDSDPVGLFADGFETDS